MTSVEQPAAQVTVELSGSAKEDAHAVFGVLHTVYSSDRAPDDVPQEPDAERPTVWAATFDTSGLRGRPDPVRLSAPVTVTLQGGYQAVDGLRSTLSSAFAVQMVGTAAGDQEQEVQLKLATR